MGGPDSRKKIFVSWVFNIKKPQHLRRQKATSFFAEGIRLEATRSAIGTSHDQEIKDTLSCLLQISLAKSQRNMKERPATSVQRRTAWETNQKPVVDWKKDLRKNLPQSPTAGHALEKGAEIGVFSKRVSEINFLLLFCIRVLVRGENTKIKTNRKKI